MCLPVQAWSYSLVCVCSHLSCWNLGDSLLFIYGSAFIYIFSAASKQGQTVCEQAQTPNLSNSIKSILCETQKQRRLGKGSWLFPSRKERNGLESSQGNAATAGAVFGIKKKLPLYCGEIYPNITSGVITIYIWPRASRGLLYECKFTDFKICSICRPALFDIAWEGFSSVTERSTR